jgi:hypothetical protein
MDVIRGFAGDVVSRTVVEPIAAEALVGLDETVQRSRVVEEVLDTKRHP